MSGAIDVLKLSDDELIQLMREYNIEYGPILDSTRRVYQRKLGKVLSGAPPEPLYTHSDENYSDQEEEEEAPPPVPARPERKEVFRQRVAQESPRKPPTQTTHLPRDDIDSQPITSSYIRQQATTTTHRTVTSTTARPASATFRTAPTPVATQNPVKTEPKTKKSGLSIWIQITIFLVVALLIFLVIQNMDPAQSNPSKKQLEGNFEEV